MFDISSQKFNKYDPSMSKDMSSKNSIRSDSVRDPKKSHVPKVFSLSYEEKSRNDSRSKFKKVQSRTTDNGWKGEVDIDSMLGSNTPSEFERNLNEYYFIEDSGIKISESKSSQSYDSTRRKMRFEKAKTKEHAKWVKDDYIKAISKLQKAYIKNNCFGESDPLFKQPYSHQQVDLLMRDLSRFEKSKKKGRCDRLETV